MTVKNCTIQEPWKLKKSQVFNQDCGNFIWENFYDNYILWNRWRGFQNLLENLFHRPDFFFNSICEKNLLFLFWRLVTGKRYPSLHERVRDTKHTLAYKKLSYKKAKVYFNCEDKFQKGHFSSHTHEIVDNKTAHNLIFWLARVRTQYHEPWLWDIWHQDSWVFQPYFSLWYFRNLGQFWPPFPF